ncbi:hypothetical protein T484DRAFT_3648471 [Baffinella frigidus]|nr:hypothetical protein T484DRAFT_3648471 [Cryptophyta sp. CCMP2293]
MVYPSDLSTTISKLNNYSRSSVKIQNETSGDVQDGNQIKFRLPSNSLIDLSSFCVHAKMTCVETGGLNGTNKVGYYPCRDLNIIRRLTIEMSNNNICTIDNYDRIRSMMLDYSMNESNKKYNLFGNANPNGLVDNTGALKGLNAGTNAGFDYDIILDRFISFLSGAPSIIDTSVTGELLITIDLVPASECLFKKQTTIADCNAPSYVLSKIYGTITKISINDGYYHTAIQSALAQGLPFKFKFPYYETAVSKDGPMTMSMRTDLQSDSIDMAFFSFCHSSANSKQTATKTVNRYLEATNSHMYLQRSLEDVTALQWNVNGMNIPAYSMDKASIYNNLLNDLGCSNDRDGGMHELVTKNAYAWAQNFGMATLSLHHPTGDGSLISGLSSEGTPVSISIDVQSTNASGNDWVGMLTVQSCRVVEVYAGRNVVLVR